MQCLRAYKPRENDELALEKADVVMVTQQSSDGKRGIHRGRLGMEGGMVGAEGLISQGCSNKAPQVGWLKWVEMYPLVVLEARSPESSAGLAMLPLKTLGKCLSSLLPDLVAPAGLAFGSITPSSVSSFCVCLGVQISLS